MANLNTLAKHSKEMYSDFWDGRKYNVSDKSIFADRTFVVLANNNHGRMLTLVDRLQTQGVELYTNNKEIKIGKALLQSGEMKKEFTIPSGSLIIPNRQPEAPLIAAILEFDAKLKKSVLIEERQKTLKNGSSIMYDTTAWNLTMMYGLPAVTVNEEILDGLSPWETRPVTVNVDSNANAWSVDGDDDRSVAFAARLMEQGLNVRITNKSTNFSGKEISRGSVFLTRMDNPGIVDLHKIILLEASNLGIKVTSTSSGYGEGDLPDWGGKHFKLLTRPQIAILSQSGFSSYDVGVSWWSIDHHLGIRHSQIDASLIRRSDLRRYNTIIIPNGYRSVGESERAILSDWVKQGGTIIANGNSAGSLASENGIGSVRNIKDTFSKRQDYDIAIQREWLAGIDDIDTSVTLSNIASTDLKYPWVSAAKALTKDELVKRDKWQSLFMPSGAMVSGRVDTSHWLSFGSTDMLPLLYADQPVLMTEGRADAVIRVGNYKRNFGAKESQTLNWSTLPAGQDITVRMSGLVWPEAAQRIANSAYLTRERVGKGQIILFSGQPNFRGSTLGTNRFWLNAVVYGAGLGASANISL
jgi:hypothetical protein